MCKAYRMEEFPFDNLHGTAESNAQARKMAESLAERYNGEIVELPGVMEYRNGIPYYKNCEHTTCFLPVFCVRYEVVC